MSKRFNLSVGDRVRFPLKNHSSEWFGEVTNIVVQETASGKLVPVAEISYMDGSYNRIAMVDVTKDIKVLFRDVAMQSRCRFTC
jgi:hypothetical protein